MKQEYAAEFFPKQFSKTERKREETAGKALTSERIASLLSLRFNREPIYKSVEDFYTPEYAEALKSGVSPSELSQIPRYRNPTQKEVNLLYCDIHSKDQLYEYSASNSPD